MLNWFCGGAPWAAWMRGNSPRVSRPRETFAPTLKWAMAAAVLFVLTLGFAVGRLTLPREDTAKLREMIEPQIRQQLRSEFADLLREEVDRTAAATLAASSHQTKAWLTEYAHLVDSRLERERTERIADCLLLKRDVDTLAINANAGLRSTEHRLAQFIDYRQLPHFSNQQNENSIND